MTAQRAMKLPEVNGLGLYADAVKKQLENAPDVIGMQEIRGYPRYQWISWEDSAKNVDEKTCLFSSWRHFFCKRNMFHDTSQWNKLAENWYRTLKVWKFGFSFQFPTFRVFFNPSMATFKENASPLNLPLFHPTPMASVKPSSAFLQECFSILTLSRRLSASRVQLLSELRQCLRKTFSLREDGCLGFQLYLLFVTWLHITYT